MRSHAFSDGVFGDWCLCEAIRIPTVKGERHTRIYSPKNPAHVPRVCETFLIPSKWNNKSAHRYSNEHLCPYRMKSLSNRHIICGKKSEKLIGNSTKTNNDRPCLRFVCVCEYNFDVWAYTPLRSPQTIYYTCIEYFTLTKLIEFVMA